MNGRSMKGRSMKGRYGVTVTMLAAVLMCGLGTAAGAEALVTHRIPAALAAEAAMEAVAFCAKNNYRETAVVVDADGARQAELRGDGAGIHTLDSANDKAYTSVSFKADTLALAERAKEPGGLTVLSQLPPLMV